MKNDAKNDAKNQESKSDAKISSDDSRCWNPTINTKRKWFNCSKPTSTGQVRGQNNLGVTYVKLSADRTLHDDFAAGGKRKAEAEEVYGPFITQLYKYQKEQNKLDEDFPHYSTFKPTWAKEEFLALAELGCRAVVRHYDKNLLSQNGDACIDIDRVTTPGTAGKK